MKTRFQKISATLLLVLAVVPLLVTFVLLTMEAWQVHQMKERLKRESLVCVSQRADQLVWLENGKEVLVNGHMFDVESWEQKGGMVYLTGLYDTQEELIRDLIHKVNSKTPGTRPAIALLSILLSPAVPANLLSFKPKQILVASVNLKNAAYIQRRLQHPMQEVQCPPPDFMAQ